jgi:Mg2+ and Co2+ transporter CorA
MNGADLSNIGNFSLGFVIVLILMVAIALLLFWYFKKKEWIMSSKEQ